MHAVQQLYTYRKNLSTTEFNARGKSLVRCEYCRIALHYCICALKPATAQQHACQAGFLLLMYDDEVLKPSNTGRLIADIVPDTYAFLWSRTSVDDNLLALLNAPQWQPVVVFPEQYAAVEQAVYSQTKQAIPTDNTKRPLFILLDGTWREAKKMLRKSAYLQKFPLLSINPSLLAERQLTVTAGYQLRNAAVSNQLATAEVAAKLLQTHPLPAEQISGDILALWFDVFNHRYQQGVCQTNQGDPAAVDNLAKYLQTLVNIND